MEQNTYREPIQTYSHPSPPYEASYEAYNSPPSMYQPNYQPTSQTSQVSSYSQALPVQGSPMNTLAQQNSIINQVTNNGYITPLPNRSSPQQQQQTTPYDMSAANQMMMEQQQKPVVNVDVAAYHSPGHPSQAFSQSSPGTATYGEMRSHRPSCDMMGQQTPSIQQHGMHTQPIQQQTQHDPNSPYTQVYKYIFRCTICGCKTEQISTTLSSLIRFTDIYANIFSRNIHRTAFPRVLHRPNRPTQHLATPPILKISWMSSASTM